MNNLFYPTVLQTTLYNAPPIGLECDENPKKFSRKNPWGNRSYADLITQAIQSSPEKRLTLSQIYDWLIRNVPYFSDKGENNSSAGWKNSIRHNLSLHKKFHRIKNDGIGKSSWWTVNPEAGSGRVPRRKTSYRRRRGKTLLAHRQLGNLPRNNICGIHSKGSIQRNAWSGRAPWNALKPANEHLQRSFQCATSVNSSTSNHLKPLNSNMSLVEALRAKSCKGDLYLRPLNQIHTESILTTQTLSLRETKSCGNFGTVKQAYLHELDVFKQMSSIQQMSVIPNQTLSTEYFSSPHHLSGSFITEVGIEKIRDVNETITNENSFQLYTEKVSKPNISNDLESKEIDLLLSSSILHDVSNFQTVLKELCSETHKCDSFNSCISVINGISNSYNSNVIDEENSTDFNKVIMDPLSPEKLFMDTTLLKVFSENEILTSDFQKHDSYLNVNPKEGVPFSFDSDFGCDPSNNLEITPERSDSQCIEKIIERLNSPKSGHISSEDEIDEDDVCNFIENQLIFENSPKLFNDKSTTVDDKSTTVDDKSRTVDDKSRTVDGKSRTVDGKSRTVDGKSTTVDDKITSICFSTSKDPTPDSNFLMTSSLSEHQECNSISSDAIMNNCMNIVVNEHGYLNEHEFLQFVSHDPAQWNLESSCFNVSKLNEISKEVPRYKKDVSNLINNKREYLAESSSDTFNLVSESNFFLSNKEILELKQSECAKLSINDDFSHIDELCETKACNETPDFIQDSFHSLEKAIHNQHAQEFQRNRNNVDLSTDLEVLPLDVHETHKLINEDFFTDIDYNHFDKKATKLMMSGLDNNNLMDDDETTSNFLLKHLSDLSNTSDTFDDNLNNLIENDNSTSVIEDYLLDCLKDDVMLDELFNYENLYNTTNLGDTNLT